MGRVKAGNLGLREAAELLEISYRQVKRIWARYRRGGAKALQHGNCGRVSNRAYGEAFRASVLGRVHERYADFGPTLAAEHLASDDALGVHAETLRRWMKQAGLWRGQRRRKAYRQRRECDISSRGPYYRISRFRAAPGPGTHRQLILPGIW